MKKAFRNIFLFVVAVVLVTALAGCNQEPAVVSDGALQVNTIRYMPYAYLGDSFDLREVLLMEEGVEYSATALYVDVSTRTDHPLVVEDLCFTPEAVAENVVTITAKRGEETAAKVIYIPTTIHAEPLDDYFKTSGGDAGVAKSVNIDPAFLQGETSTTSLHVTFNGPDAHPYGVQFGVGGSAPDAQEYFTDQTWENAIFTCWVYNPMDQDIEFQLRVIDEKAGTNIDWQTGDGPHKQFAKAGEWTQLFFSLRRMGTVSKLTRTKYNQDYVSLKVRYNGYSTTDAYTFDFYIDNIDVVDGSMYPDVDTKYVLSNEDLEQGWENMAMDKGWQGVYTEYDYDVFTGEGSTCSLKALFNNDKAKTNSFICLSPQGEDPNNLPDMTGGTLTGYFKFENLDASVGIDILNKSWATSNKVNMSLTPVGDGWYYGVVNLEDLEVGNGRNDNIIRIRFHFSGVSDSSVVYMDTVKFNYKYVDKVLESVAADWINLATDRGAYYWNVETKYVSNMLKGSNTVRSLRVSAPSNAAGKFTFSTQASVSAGDLANEPNMTYGTLGAWFYFGKQLPNASVRVTSENWKGSVSLPFVFTQNAGDGWYYGELHGSDIKFTESANASEIIRITIDIPKGYTIYMDNLHWDPSFENPLVAAEIDSSVLFDGGDFLADTNVISYDKHHWENVDNDDDKPDTVAGLTCGVDTENVTGAYSVRSWYFKASADSSTSNAIAQLKFAKGYDMTNKLLAFDIRLDSETKIQQTISLRLHTSKWSDINTTNKYIKLNYDETWKTVVLDFSDVYLEGKDITDFGMMSFYFDFLTNTGKDRAIYVDNVRLIKPDEIPEGAIMTDEEPMPLGPEDLYDGGDWLANATLEWNPNEWNGQSGSYDANSTEVYTENEVGKYSVKSWKFYTTKDNWAGNVQLKLNQYFDLVGKDLIFDAKFVNATQTIGIELWNGWSALQADQTPIYTVTGDGSDGWQTFTIPAEALYEALKDKAHNEIFMIRFRMNFASDTTGEHAIYIDNVRTADTDIYELKSDLLGGATAEATDWTAENGLTVLQDGENVTGEDSLRSWAFTATAEANIATSVKFDLGENMDMTGKYMLMDTLTVAEQAFTLTLLDEEGNAVSYPIAMSAEAGEDWNTAVVPASLAVMEEKDLTAVRYIEIGFDYTTNTGADRSLNMDNVRLIDAEAGSDDMINLPMLVYGEVNVAFNNKYLKADDSTVSLKVVTADLDETQEEVGVIILDTSSLTIKHRGSIGAWFYFGEQEPKAVISTVDSADNNAQNAVEFVFGEGQDGWYYGTADLSLITYAEDVTPGNVAVAVLGVPEGTVYIDGLVYADITEDATTDMINISHDSGVFSTDMVADNKSVHSLFIDVTDNTVRVTFTPESKLDFVGGKLTAWFNFGGNDPSKIRFLARNEEGTGSSMKIFDFSEPNADGWCLGTLDMTVFNEDQQAVLKETAEFQIIVPKDSDVYIDNLIYIPAETTE